MCVKDLKLINLSKCWLEGNKVAQKPMYLFHKYIESNPFTYLRSLNLQRDEELLVVHYYQYFVIYLFIRYFLAKSICCNLYDFSSSSYFVGGIIKVTLSYFIFPSGPLLTSPLTSSLTSSLTVEESTCQEKAKTATRVKWDAVHPEAWFLLNLF